MASNKTIAHKLILHKKYNGLCGYCGDPITVKSMTNDHIIPKKHFKNWIKKQVNIPEWLSHLTTADLNHIDNKMPSCHDCNNTKGNLSLEEFRKELERIHLHLMKKHVWYRTAIKFNLVSFHHVHVIFHYEKTLIKTKEEKKISV